MEGIPSLPPAGPLRLLAVSGSISLFLFVGAAIAALRNKPRRLAAWPLALFVFALATGVLGRASSNLHNAAAFLTAGIAVVTLIRTRGVPRVLVAFGAVAWGIAIFSARALFH